MSCVCQLLNKRICDDDDDDGAAPLYLSQLLRVTDLPCRRPLRSARTNLLLVPSVKLSTVGGWAFPVAGPTI